MLKTQTFQHKRVKFIVLGVIFLNALVQETLCIQTSSNSINQQSAQIRT